MHVHVCVFHRDLYICSSFNLMCTCEAKHCMTPNPSKINRKTLPNVYPRLFQAVCVCTGIIIIIIVRVH